jgi:WD repeat-containing and planar cell polarity effector protein
VDESKNEISALRNIPPLPKFQNLDFDSPQFQSNRSKANEIAILGKSQLTQRNLQKLNKLSSDKGGFKAIDQTVGIPLMTGNEFTHRIGTSQMYASYSTEEIRDQMQHHSLGPPIHNYPLISGSIPSLSIHSHIPTLSNPHKKDVQVSSILSNVNATYNNASKKESGEKNKVKFSDTVTIAVVKENPQERLKRKSYLPGSSIDGISSRKELAESLPLCHPHQDYLKDFMPATERSSKIEEKKSKSSIKVVNFGLL